MEHKEVVQLEEQGIHKHFWHPDFGLLYQRMTTNLVRVVRIDTAGNLYLPAGPVFQGGDYWGFFESDIEITDGGRVFVTWAQHRIADSEIDINTAWFGWSTFFDAEDDPLPAIPSFISLSAYPNPFNSRVKIEYELPRAGEVGVVIYNTAGQRVTTLVDARTRAGLHHVEWAPESASGVYFVRLAVSDHVVTRKLLYLR